MSKLIWYILFVSLPFSVLCIDLNRLYGHLRPPPQKRSGKYLIWIHFSIFFEKFYCPVVCVKKRRMITPYIVCDAFDITDPTLYAFNFMPFNLVRCSVEWKAVVGVDCTDGCSCVLRVFVMQFSPFPPYARNTMNMINTRLMKMMYFVLSVQSLSLNNL